MSLFKGCTLFFFASAIFISCIEKSNQSASFQSEPVTADTKMITEVGKLSFRKSYAGHNKMTERELKKLTESDPYITQSDDTSLKHSLEQIGLIEDDKLLVSKFKIIEAQKIELSNKTGNKIEVSLNHNGLGHYQIYFQKSNYTDSLVIGNLNDVYFKIENIIPGGYEEVILIIKEYIANGDNYDLYVYKIK